MPESGSLTIPSQTPRSPEVSSPRLPSSLLFPSCHVCPSALCSSWYFCRWGTSVSLQVADLALSYQSIFLHGGGSAWAPCPQVCHLQSIQYCPAHALLSSVSPFPSVTFPFSEFASLIALSFSVSQLFFTLSLTFPIHTASLTFPWEGPQSG